LLLTHRHQANIDSLAEKNIFEGSAAQLGNFDLSLVEFQRPKGVRIGDRGPRIERIGARKYVFLIGTCFPRYSKFIKYSSWVFIRPDCSHYVSRDQFQFGKTPMRCAVDEK